MEITTDWIEHLKHPLVLIGFGLFILVILLKPIFSNGNNKLSGKATERIISKAINVVFILSFLVIAAGFIISLTTNPHIKSQTTEGHNNREVIEQHTSGVNSPTVSGKDVNINYGGTIFDKKKTDQRNFSPSQKRESTQQVKQTTQGDLSPSINSSGDVIINYAK